MVQGCQYRRHEDDGKKTRTGTEILITIKQALDAVIMEEKMKDTTKRDTLKPDNPLKDVNQDAKVKDEVTQAREKFLEDMQKLGFPVNIQGKRALEQRRQNEGSWASKPKEQDKPMKADEAP